MEQKELRDLEARCIQEWAPWCTSTCPVHVDARGMCAALSKGDFSAAAKLFAKTVPFPGIISRVCDHPCQTVCKRRDAGEAISIRSLELAALSWGSPLQAKIQTLPPKNRRMAVVGAGLSGLTAAVDLARKGYQVVLFEASGRLGGTVWDYPAEVLPRDVIAADLDALHKLAVEVRLGTALGTDVSAEELRQEFDTVYLGTGVCVEQPGLDCNADGTVRVHEVTFESSLTGVFAGGACVRGRSGRSPIRSISDGRRAALSMDRFAQKVSLTYGRELDGPYETRLFTSTEGIESSAAVVPADPQKGYTADEGVAEARRCLHCECMECVKVCEYLATFKGYPKKYLRQIYNNLSIVMGQRHGNLLINSCSICGLCAEVCPEDLHTGLVCKTARATMVKQGRMPPSAHEFALRDMVFSTGEQFAMARHEPGTDASAWVFFPGCQLSASSPGNVKRTYAYLRERLSGGVGLMLGCCAAPADWAGRTETFGSLFTAFEERWVKMGSPRLITACSTCYSIFASRLPAGKVESLWVLVDELGLPDVQRTGIPVPVALHDPCTSRHESRVQESVRRILHRLGYQVEEMPLSRNLTECCGFGGLMSFANRPLAERVIRRRIDARPEPFIAYCAVCRDYFTLHGKPTWHLLDLLFGQDRKEDAVQRGPGYSQRRENRFRLKRSLLKDLWGEDVAEQQDRQAARLFISDDVRDLLEERMILEEDLQQVIGWAERTGVKLAHQETGRFLAHHKPSNVTYWVEYSPTGDGFTVHNAYSHRMEIVEDTKP